LCLGRDQHAFGGHRATKSFLNGATELGQLERHRKRLAGTDVIKPRVRKGCYSCAQRWTQEVFKSSTDEIAITPLATIRLLLALKALETIKELMNQFASFLHG
jgi:hypothetical protein